MGRGKKKTNHSKHSTNTRDDRDSRSRELSTRSATNPGRMRPNITRPRLTMLPIPPRPEILAVIPSQESMISGTSRWREFPPPGPTCNLSPGMLPGNNRPIYTASTPVSTNVSNDSVPKVQLPKLDNVVVKPKDLSPTPESSSFPNYSLPKVPLPKLDKVIVKPKNLSSTPESTNFPNYSLPKVPLPKLDKVIVKPKNLSSTPESSSFPNYSLPKVPLSKLDKVIVKPKNLSSTPESSSFPNYSLPKVPLPKLDKVIVKPKNLYSTPTSTSFPNYSLPRIPLPNLEKVIVKPFNPQELPSNTKVTHPSHPHMNLNSQQSNCSLPKAGISIKSDMFTVVAKSDDGRQIKSYPEYIGLPPIKQSEQVHPHLPVTPIGYCSVGYLLDIPPPYPTIPPEMEKHVYKRKPVWLKKVG